MYALNINSKFNTETVITLSNVKEILADMGVEYTLKKYAKVASVPSIYKDGKAYEIKSTVCRGYRKGISKAPNSRMFLEGKTIQEVLDFLNGVKENSKEEFADNIIKRPGLQASMQITITPEGPKPEWEGYRPSSMEGMYSLDPKRAEIINRILRGPKKHGHKVRKGGERIGDNCKPTYDITTGKLSETVTHFNKYSNPSCYNKEVTVITKSCEYQTPAVAPGEPYDGHQFQWVSEMPIETLTTILSDMKAAQCRTYADWQKKLARKEAKKLANDLVYAANKVNNTSSVTVSEAFMLEMLKALKDLTEVVRELKEA